MTPWPLSLALVTLACSGCERRERPQQASPEIRVTPEPKPAAVNPPSSPIAAGGTAEIDAALPAVPRWLQTLEDHAELLCTCTTPSCIHRFSVKIAADRRGMPSPIPARWASRLDALDDRVSACRDVAGADGLGEIHQDAGTTASSAGHRAR